MSARRATIACALGLAVGVLGACGTPGDPGGTTPSSSPQPSYAATTSSNPCATSDATLEATPSSPRDAGLELYLDAPALALGPAGGWDSGLMEPGAVTYHDDQFHMFFNAIPSWPHVMSTGYATSIDGITFVRETPEPVFTLAEVSWAEPPASVMVNSVLVEDGTWILYFTGTSSVGEMTGAVGRATAPSPMGPWAVDPEPVLEPGPTGAWDASGIGHVEVLRCAAGYVMYYASERDIGMAASTDGIHWAKYDDPTTDEAMVDSDRVLAGVGTDPNVYLTSDGFAMTYRFSERLYHATSADGIRWQVTDDPIVAPPGVRIWNSAIVIHDGSAHLYFEGGSPAETMPYLATWTENGRPT